MAANKQYSGATVVADLCKWVGVLTMILGIVVPLAWARTISAQIGSLLNFAISMSVVIAGLVMMAVGQVVEAVIDTAKNTAALVEAIRTEPAHELRVRNVEPK